MPTDRRPSDAEKDEYNLKSAEIVKDAVSFYNSYGGYLVIGVRDNPRSLVGFVQQFNCDDFNKKLKSAIGQDVECIYKILQVNTVNSETNVGLLYIPQRPDNLPPAQFRRDAPTTPSGRKAYRKHDIYFRDGSECKPAISAEDLSFLCSQGTRRKQSAGTVEYTSVLSNNFGPRDPGFIRFVGRDEYISELWRWFCDRYTLCKLLAGIGGVGKTTIAREFAEDVTRTSPMGFERVIWLSAKKRLYTAIRGEYEETSRVDFHDTRTLLQAIDLELGWIERNDLDVDASKEELIDDTVEALSMIPSFIVIDDLDTLPDDQQNDVFHTLIHIANRSLESPIAPSRILLTARLELGASPQQLLKVSGLPLDEFKEYLSMTADALGLNWGTLPKSQTIQRFHSATDGSPTFASSILRLVSLGEDLMIAINHWKGADGEEVRAFAFEKELGSLEGTKIRTLYAICLLGTTNLIELHHITETPKSVIRDNIGALRNYHLVSHGSDQPAGSPTITVPNSIRVMSNLIRKHVLDPKRIETECAKARKSTKNLDIDIGKVVQNVVSLWKDGASEEALETAIWSNKNTPNNPNLKCLLGRAYLRIEPPKASEADTSFRKAHELNCTRTELYTFWIEAKKILGDWHGVIELTRLADQRKRTADNVFIRASAYSELAEQAKSAGNLTNASLHYLKCGQDIDKAFAQGYARGRVQELRDIRSAMMHNYVEVVDRITQDPNQYLDVWLAMLKAFDCYVRYERLIELGVCRLQGWWDAVELRDTYEASTAAAMEQQLYEYDRLLSIVGDHEWDDRTDLYNRLAIIRRELEQRWEAYRKELTH